jgi:hypothetical protein
MEPRPTPEIPQISRLAVYRWELWRTDPTAQGFHLLTDRYIAHKNADLVAELVSCMRYLRFVESPSYRRGLSCQNPDGSWGDRERNRRRHGPWGLHHVILHTTVVALDALTIGFHEPWNDELFPGCGAL